MEKTDLNPDAEGAHRKDEQPTDLVAKLVLKAGSVFASLFLVSMGIMIYEVVMRYVFDSPTIWVHETTIFLCAICFVFGGLHSVSRNGHIRVVLLYDYLPAHIKRWFDVVIYFICGSATAMFSYALWPTVVKSFWAPSGEFRMITSGSAWNPPFPTMLRAFLLFVLVVMTIQFVLLMIHHLRGKNRV